MWDYEYSVDGVLDSGLGELGWNPFRALKKIKINLKPPKKIRLGPVTITRKDWTRKVLPAAAVAAGTLLIPGALPAVASVVGSAAGAATSAAGTAAGLVAKGATAALPLVSKVGKTAVKVAKSAPVQEFVRGVEEGRKVKIQKPSPAVAVSRSPSVQRMQPASTSSPDNLLLYGALAAALLLMMGGKK